MFEADKPIYMTRAVAEELPDELKYFIVQYLHGCHHNLTDYLQVFEFSNNQNKQLLRQRQEQPYRETQIFVPLKDNKVISRTVWAMDQVDHVLFLFPENY
ncbi:DUF960 family protein [Metabacillus sp. YM-086]|uniref:DUF960 family protein n=1 Tax=Metabacillus sp. YM-086 TaxID=3341729 RepID=UPI003A8863B3